MIALSHNEARARDDFLLNVGTLLFVYHNNRLSSGAFRQTAKISVIVDHGAVCLRQHHNCMTGIARVKKLNQFQMKLVNPLLRNLLIAVMPRKLLRHKDNIPLA